MSSHNSPPDQPNRQQYAAPAPQAQFSSQQGISQYRPRPLNVFGLVAVIVLVLYTFYSFIQPFMMRQLIESGSYTALSVINGGLLLVCAFTAIALAIIGLVLHRNARARWLSWVALGGAGLVVLQSLLAMIGNWLAFQILPF